MSSFPNAIDRRLNQKLGEIPSIVDFGAVGDAITVEDLSIASGTTSISSLTAQFNPANVGKKIIINGAGPAGLALETSILSVLSPTSAIVEHTAVATVSNAHATWGTDNLESILKALAVTQHLTIPIGRYLVFGQIPLIDRVGIKLLGYGDGSVLIPSSHLDDNFFDLSGSIDVEFSHFQIDGRHFPDISFQCIYGDGTGNNPIYGNIRIRHMLIVNFPGLTFGVGANTPYTADSVTYERNRFVNCSYGSFGANTIDTGSSGTKLGYRLIENEFIYITQPTVNPGNCIFAGHGTNEDFLIRGNIITDCPTTGINIHNRPFIGEATSLTNFIVTQNIIRRPRWNGISIFGGSHVVVSSNTILNPGFEENAINETRCGILVSTQTVGDPVTAHLGGANLLLSGNTIIDDQSTHTMRFAILESTPGGGATQDTAGVISNNIILGASVDEISVLTKFAILHNDSGGKNWRVGKANALSARLTTEGDIRAAHPSVSLFTQLSIESSQAAADFLSGLGFNVRFDAVSGNWVSGFDGASNGFGLIAVDHGAGRIDFFAKGSTGGTAQSVTPANLQLVKVFSIESGNIFRFHPGSIFLDGGIINRVLKINASKQLTYGQVDLASADDTINQLNANRIADASVSNAAFQFLSGATSNIQAQLDDHEARIAALELVMPSKANTGAYGTDVADGHSHTFTL